MIFNRKREALTIIEVMMAVMIISIVITVMIKIQGDTSNRLLQIKKMMDTAQYNSLFISTHKNNELGIEDKELEQIVDNFDLDDDLRHRLINTMVSIKSEEVKDINKSNISNYTKSGNLSNGFENNFNIDRVVMTNESFTNTLYRVRVIQ